MLFRPVDAVLYAKSGVAFVFIGVRTGFVLQYESWLRTFSDALFVEEFSRYERRSEGLVRMRDSRTKTRWPAVGTGLYGWGKSSICGKKGLFASRQRMLLVAPFLAHHRYLSKKSLSRSDSKGAAKA
jgi:hypothetical protein